MDSSHRGTITLSEFRKVMVNKFSVSESEVRDIFAALDSNHDNEISYSNFLAAMISARITMCDDLLSAAFKKFDVDATGYITAGNLLHIFPKEDVVSMVCEAGLGSDGLVTLSYADFVSYLSEPHAADEVH